MKLLELPEGMLSLEFLPAEGDEVMRRLKQFGPVKRRWHASYDKITVGNVDFLRENEWDQPCLISTSPAGAALLRQLISKLTHSKAA